MPATRNTSKKSGNYLAHEELTALNQRAQELLPAQAVSHSIDTREQKELYVTLTTLETTTQRCDVQIAVLLQTANTDVTEAISAVARSLGLTMILDLFVASESGLVVFCPTIPRHYPARSPNIFTARTDQQEPHNSL